MGGFGGDVGVGLAGEFGGEGHFFFFWMGCVLRMMGWWMIEEGNEEGGFVEGEEQC